MSSRWVKSSSVQEKIPLSLPWLSALFYWQGSCRQRKLLRNFSREPLCHHRGPVLCITCSGLWGLIYTTIRIPWGHGTVYRDRRGPWQRSRLISEHEHDKKCNWTFLAYLHITHIDRQTPYNCKEQSWSQITLVNGHFCCYIDRRTEGQTRRKEGRIYLFSAPSLNVSKQTGEHRYITPYATAVYVYT